MGKGFLIDGTLTRDGIPYMDVSTINGKQAGTFFGDDFTTTTRRSILSAKWSQGLPLYGADWTITGSARWYILSDPESSYLDGASKFESGTTADAKLLINTLQHNRYECGHLSYFGYTAAWDIANANGDFVALIGALVRGSSSQALGDQIKDGMMWGYKRESDVTSKVLRVYKNFEYTDYDLLNGMDIDFSKLNIYEHQIGYYGIHPSVIWAFNQNEMINELLDYHQFNSIYTSVHDPNLALGIYIENQGNTGNVGIINGSIEFGNYSIKDHEIDAGSRELADSVSVASKAVDSDPTDGSGFIAAYRVTDYFESYNEVNSSGTTTTSFHSKIENELLQIAASASASSTVTANIYLIPEADITATFTALNPYTNVLERATSYSALSFTNAQRIFSLLVTSGGVGQSGFGANSQALNQIKPKLRPGIVAILSLSSVTSVTVTNFRVDLLTRDLF